MRRLLVILVLLSLAGCLNVTITHEIQSDASSQATIHYDMSALEGMMQGMEGFADELADIPAGDGTAEQSSEADALEEEALQEAAHEEDICEAFADAPFSCEQLGELELRLTGNWDVPPERLRISKSLLGTSYELDARAGLDLLKLINDDDEISFTEINQLGGTVTYDVTLPGKITTYQTGELINQNTLRINLLEISQSTPTLVQAEEKNQALLYALYALLGILVITLVLVAITRLKSHKKEEAILSKSPAQAHAEATLSDQERRYKNYIEQYRQDYSREALQEVLQQAGLKTQKANEYLNKYY